MVLKSYWNTGLSQRSRPSVHIFWFLALLGFLAMLSVSLSLDLGTKIQRGYQAQTTIQMLDRVRRSMLDLMGVHDTLVEKPMSDWRREIIRILADSERRIDDYRHMAVTEPELQAHFEEYLAIFTNWKQVIVSFTQHPDLAHTDKTHLYEQLLESNRQFLQAMYALDRDESYLHQQMHDGLQAAGLLVLGVVLFSAWSGLLILIYQRLTVRQGQVRDSLNRVTLASVGDGLVTTDPGGIVSFMNPVAEHLTGWSLTEANGRPLQDIFHLVNAETGDELENPVSRVLAHGQVTGLDDHTLLKSRNGQEYNIAHNATPVLDGQGRCLGMVLVFRDVSEACFIKLTMELQTQQLQEVQRSMHIGYWEIDPVSEVMDWSEETCCILEVTCSPGQDLKQCYMDRLHPDDRERIHQSIKDAVAEHKRLDINHRLLMPDGRIKHVHLMCNTDYDGQGQPLRFSGTLQDITQRTLDEQELRLAATTFQTHAGILITDAKGIILRANPAMEAMTGYTVKELIGQSPRILKSGNQTAQFYRDMWNTVAERGQWSGELWNRRKDGSLYAEWLTITEVRDEQSRLLHYVGTSQDITERMHAEARIEHLAYHDELTDLPNRRRLRERLQQEQALARRHNTHGSILFIDLDHFKHLNDALGHPVGDELLRQMARRLQSLVREEDTVARLGGDEFIVLLPAQEVDEAAAASEANTVAEKILKRLGEVYHLIGHQYHMHVSIGIVIFPEQHGNADDILKHADSALYQAKDAGRNTISFFQPSMQEAASQRLTLERDLRLALENNDFELHYQPQVDAWGKITGCEALIRWQHPDKGMIPPEEFIPIAEDTGLIVDLGHWVIRESVKQQKQWHQQGLCKAMERIAINLSARQFHHKGFPEQMLAYCEDAGVEPGCLELEITESMMMKNIHDTIDNMQRLREMGFRFSVDDFGTGYSSLSYLKQLPISQLKIDRSFVRDITTDQNDRAIVDTVIAMAQHMGLNVIAEGVETREQLAFLEKRGCPMFQGYLFSPPVAADEMALLLLKGTLPGQLPDNAEIGVSNKD